MIARDPRPMEVYAVEFVVDNNTLGFVATDADKNITLFHNTRDFSKKYCVMIIKTLHHL